MSATTFVADCHLHAHWPQKYPYSRGAGSRIEVDDLAVSREGLFPILAANGVTHALIIQPGAYGSDNRAMLDAIAGSQGRAKGIAVLDYDTPDEEFINLKRQGIVGVRLSLIHSGSKAFEHPEMGSFLARCREHGFHVQVFAAAAVWPDLIPKLLDSGVEVIVEHIGWPIVPEGIRQPGFQAILQFGRSTNAVMKITGGFRITQTGEPYDDVAPFVAEAVAAFGPDRCIWGTDWPFLNPQNGPIIRPFPWKLDYSTELHSLTKWVPDQAQRSAILWETPARLFGFSEVDGPA